MTDTQTFEVLTWPKHNGLPWRATTLLHGETEAFQAEGRRGRIDSVSKLRKQLSAHLNIDPTSITFTGITPEDVRACEGEAARSAGPGMEL